MVLFLLLKNKKLDKDFQYIYNGDDYRYIEKLYD